mmetsp:Transcript_5874/g.13057  ORF Transcript_5874/g.13057 Transcript_5874/m.13057 type:complete len:204 (-) Transcript_5874:1499-2110(-)
MEPQAARRRTTGAAPRKNGTLGLENNDGITGRRMAAKTIGKTRRKRTSKKVRPRKTGMRDESSGLQCKPACGCFAKDGRNALPIDVRPCAGCKKHVNSLQSIVIDPTYFYLSAYTSSTSSSSSSSSPAAARAFRSSAFFFCAAVMGFLSAAFLSSFSSSSSSSPWSSSSSSSSSESESCSILAFSISSNKVGSSSNSASSGWI